MYRRPTNPALERARKNLLRPSLPSDRKEGQILDRFSAYDYPWEKIEEYLRGKWPAWDFNPRKSNDTWIFEVPEKLNESDRRELRNRRDAPKRTQQPSVSPEPELTETSESS